MDESVWKAASEVANHWMRARRLVDRAVIESVAMQSASIAAKCTVVAVSNAGAAALSELDRVWIAVAAALSVFIQVLSEHERAACLQVDQRMLGVY